tara:strand:- start:47 stop:265 length:219 start_codon:yes stop_codon:yes gene_type:complete
MGKKSIIEAIKKIEMDSGMWDDDQLEQLKEMDLKELKKYIKQYDNYEEYSSKQKNPLRPSNDKKFTGHTGRG